MYGNVRGNQVKCLNGCGHCIQKKSGIVICHCINMWEGGIRLPESIWKYFWYNIHELLKHGCCISFYFMGTFCELWVRKPAWQRKEGASVKSIRYFYHFYFTFSEVPSFRLHEQVNNIYEKRGSQMKNRYLSTRIMAIMGHRLQNNHRQPFIFWC